MSDNKDERIECGRFFAVRPTKKKPFWQVGYYDTAAEQTRYRTLRPLDQPKGFFRDTDAKTIVLVTEALIRFAEDNKQLVVGETDSSRVRADLREAMREGSPLTSESAAVFAAEADEARQETEEMVPQHDLPVRVCLIHYKALRGPHMASASVIVDAMTTLVNTLGEKVTCRQMTGERQDRIVAALRKDGLADWTTLTRLKCIWAAMRYCVRKNLLAKDAVPERVPADNWDPPANLPVRNVRGFGRDEVIRMFIAAQRHEHWWRWIVQQTGEVCRPMAPNEITYENVDFETGNVELLELEKQGVQTKKRKAIVRACPTLLKWLAYWRDQDRSRPLHHDRHIITYQGRRLRSMHFHQQIAEAAGVDLPEKAGAYVWRHFLITWLARHSVPEEQRLFLSGHAVSPGAHGGYIHFEPDYCAEAVAALDKLFRLIAECMPAGSRDLLNPGFTKSSDGASVPEEKQWEDQPEADCVLQQTIHMLRGATHLVKRAPGVPVATFLELMNQIRA